MEQLKASAHQFFTTTLFTSAMWRMQTWWRYLLLGLFFVLSPYLTGAFSNDYSLTARPDGLVTLWLQGCILGLLSFACAIGLLSRFLPELRQTTLVSAQDPAMEKTVLWLDQLFACTVVFLAVVGYCIATRML